MSAWEGNDSVDLQSAITSGGSCQYEVVGFERGNPGDIAALHSIFGTDGMAVGVYCVRVSWGTVEIESNTSRLLR